MMTVDVTQDESRSRFVVDLGDGDEAYLDYEEREDGVLDYASTFVPEEHRGRGIAEQLVVTALEWASETDREVVASCPYVNHVVEDVHPRFRSLLAPNA